METKNMNYTEDHLVFNNDLTNPAQNLLIASGILHNFVTRTDNYAVQNGDGNYHTQNRELTLSAIQDHINGKTTVGAYSLDSNNQVKYLTLDIDLARSKTGEIEQFKPVLATTAKRVVAECRAIGIEPILEFSGFKGFHVTILFDEPVPATQAKRLGEAIVKRVGELPDHLHIEVFPKQDKLTPTQPFGNLVKLPLALHKVSKQRSCFMNTDTFEPVEDALEFLRNAPKTSTRQVNEIVGSLPAPTPVHQHEVSSANMQLNQPGLERMIEHCPIIKAFEANPCGWQHDPWLGIASNYRVCTGGWERFTELCKREPERFDQERLDHLFVDIAENWNGPQSYETFADQGVKFELPVGAPKAPAGWASKYDPIESPIVERNGCYGKLGKEGVFCMLTPFTIDTGELLMLPDGDVLNCTIKHISGQEWTGITIENTDWHTRGKLMKATKHSEGTFHGTDLDVIDLCHHVISKVKVRKQGTRSIGLHDEMWVVRDLNLTAAGQVNPMQIMPYDRSSDSLHARVKYSQMPDDEYATMISTFFNNILTVNQPEVMLPILGWFFAVPLKPRIMDLVGSFPALFCYGTQGGGKTSLLEMLMSLQGYDDPVVSSCTMKQFPMLKLLSSTNAVPVVLDEYKPYDMRDGQVMDLTRMLRKVYRGEIEDKGNPDQTVTHYHLTAPVVLCGESKVKESAVLERVLIAGFTDEIKKNTACQTAFRSLKGLDLQAFMARYIPFCLGVDVATRLADAETAVKTAVTGKSVAPRIQNNITAMVFGLSLMQDFAAKYGISMAGQIDLQKAIDIQIEEVTGAGNGQVKLAVDMMLEQLAIMVEKEIAKKEIDFTFTRMDSLPGGKKVDREKSYLAINLKIATQTFSANAWRIGYKGEILGEADYLKQLKTVDYVAKLDHQKRFKPYGAPKGGVNKKCVVIDLQAAEAKGLEIAGFFAVSQECKDEENENSVPEETPKLKCSVLETKM